jgi:hypothetical protein
LPQEGTGQILPCSFHVPFVHKKASTLAGYLEWTGLRRLEW